MPTAYGEQTKLADEHNRAFIQSVTGRDCTGMSGNECFMQLSHCPDILENPKRLFTMYMESFPNQKRVWGYALYFLFMLSFHTGGQPEENSPSEEGQGG